MRLRYATSPTLPAWSDETQGEPILLTHQSLPPACAVTPDNSLVAAIAKDSPNTKVIPYPLHVGNEEDTIGLVDDVLNSWGRCVMSHRLRGL
jgi:hypothetical protein